MSVAIAQTYEANVYDPINPATCKFVQINNNIEYLVSDELRDSLKFLKRKFSNIEKLINHSIIAINFLYKEYSEFLIKILNKKVAKIFEIFNNENFKEKLQNFLTIMEKICNNSRSINVSKIKKMYEEYLNKIKSINTKIEDSNLDSFRDKKFLKLLEMKLSCLKTNVSELLDIFKKLENYINELGLELDKIKEICDQLERMENIFEIDYIRRISSNNLSKYLQKCFEEVVSTFLHSEKLENIHHHLSEKIKNKLIELLSIPKEKFWYFINLILRVYYALKNIFNYLNFDSMIRVYKIKILNNNNLN